MPTDARVTAGVNLDGSVRPLLLFGEQHLSADEAAGWAEFWKKQRGPRLQLSLLGSLHATFTDFAAQVPQAAPILGKPPSWVIEGIGTINGERAVTVERACIGASPARTALPEVRFVR